MSKKLAFTGVILAGCGMLVGPALLGLVAVLFGASAQAAANPCVTSPASSTRGRRSARHRWCRRLPAQVGPYKGDQVANAAVIITAGQAMGLDAKAITIGVMTAMGESHWSTSTAGLGPDPGPVPAAGNGAWGSYEERMNPTIASTSFFKALNADPGYLSLEPTIAAHKVQRNADPYHYAPYWPDAVLMVSTLTADPSCCRASISPG